MGTEMTVRIYKNPNGDTRTAPLNVTFKQFQEANDMHIEDVKNVMNEIAYKLMNQAKDHDYTKKWDEEEFYLDFLAQMKYDVDFVSNTWYQKHIDKERHHLTSKCPDDVDLLDVIEMITDCVCAGMTRSGEVRDLEINDDILRLAVKNTVDMIASMIKVVK